MNIHGLKLHLQKARNMMREELTKPASERNKKKIKNIRNGISNLHDKIRERKKFKSLDSKTKRN